MRSGYIRSGKKFSVVGSKRMIKVLNLSAKRQNWKAPMRKVNSFVRWLVSLLKGKRMRCQECAASSKFGLRELEGDGNDGHKGGSLEVPFDFGRYLEEKD